MHRITAVVLLPSLLSLLLEVAFGAEPAASVHVLYYAANNWVDAVVNGAQPCPGVQRCEWTQSPHIHQLKEKFHRDVVTAADSPISVAVFHVHSMRDKLNSRYPLNCDWRTNLTFGCSEESGVRYGHLFNATFPNFDGFSSYHPRSSVQRIQHAAYFKESDLRPTLHNFSSLIKAGSYVAKDCHTKGGDRANANRDQVVLSIRQAGFRIDGLSKCMRSQTPEGVYLPKTHDTVQNLLLKREAIARFMFNMAFENSIEEGYVTEKPFDALIAGTVPVYLGDAAHLKRLLPHPKAAIFIADYNGNMQALATYLNYLTRNETAYEEHRAWRKTFSYEENVRNKPLLQKSWYCRVCEWAVAAAARRPPSAGGGNGTADSATVAAAVAGSAGGKGAAPADHCVLQEKLRRPCAHLDTFAGKPLKSAANGDLFLVENGTIRAIPNADTFAALKVRLWFPPPLSTRCNCLPPAWMDT